MIQIHCRTIERQEGKKEEQLKDKKGRKEERRTIQRQEGKKGR